MFTSMYVIPIKFVFVYDVSRSQDSFSQHCFLNRAQYVEHLEGLSLIFASSPEWALSRQANVNCTFALTSSQWQALLVDNCTFSSRAGLRPKKILMQHSRFLTLAV